MSGTGYAGLPSSVYRDEIKGGIMSEYEPVEHGVVGRREENILVAENTDRRSTQVQDQLQQQPELIELLHQSLNELERRLGGVLVEEADVSEIAVDPDKVPYIVPVADLLRMNNKNIRVAHLRVVSMLDRLEL